MEQIGDWAQGDGYHDGKNRAARVMVDKTDDSGEQQLVDYRGVNGEQHTKVVRAQYFGLSTHAPKDSEGIMAALSNRDSPMLVGLESPKHRPKNLPEGATKLYDKDGTFVYLDADGNIHAKTRKKAFTEAGEMAHVKAPDIKLEGNVEITGTLVVADAVTTGSSITSAGAHIASAHV